MSQDDGRTDQRVAKEELSDLTARCIRCGFCLEACPTYVLTGHETESPRGRIYLVRSAEEGKIAWEQARPHLDRCLGCRACEPACPSGVQYGQILELSRDRLEERRPHRAKRWLLAGVTSPVRLRLQLLVGKLWPGKRVPGWLSRLLSREAPEADLPRALPDCCWPPLEEAKLPPVRGEVYLLEGCAMRVLYPGVHEATRRLLRRVGYSVREAEAGCCGALHAHNGQLEEAKKMAAELASALDMAGDPARPASTPLTPSSSRSAPGGGGEAPLIVNSAGCGSFLKEQPEWEDRVFDAAEFLFRNGLAQALAEAPGLRACVTYHDACHLGHGQGIRREPRELLQAIPGIEYVELEEADRCCGSAGIYNLLQPKLARALLERKQDFLERSGAEIVALGNPGCHAWIAQGARERGARVRVLHTMEVLERAFLKEGG
jgi:glycolate oxidase iron-sulfur subunit